MTQGSQQDAPFVAQCAATGATVTTSTANEVVAFYRRRQRLLDTDIEWVSAEHRAVSQAPESDDVAYVLRELDDDFERGVPLGILAAAMSKQGRTVGDTLADVYDLRMAGSLWEPRSDYLRPV
ncbi:hypothetical protein SAMN05443574_12012 [Haloarcula vallismortis]|uniref:HVO-B0008-like C-terminal domain-containing protein n=2 Tax=Haloarcula vallismortis TaxID=28442 RepID=M0JII2_HALVA|nr:hypothetical protein [Haloarcula vallismortis]EMA08811.1 hypothetical protein C437_07637 [Haloarcula vallismortis ATCC 29715]SDX22705.1 hypothetical protein SAMN05443574_12012 [Haloarcula vallismortis]